MVCMCSPKICMLKPNKGEMLGGWAFGKWLDHESEDLMNGISILTKESPDFPGDECISTVDKW